MVKGEGCGYKVQGLGFRVVGLRSVSCFFLSAFGGSVGFGVEGFRFGVIDNLGLRIEGLWVGFGF